MRCAAELHTLPTSPHQPPLCQRFTPLCLPSTSPPPSPAGPIDSCIPLSLDQLRPNGPGERRSTHAARPSCTASRRRPTNRPVPATHSPLPSIDLQPAPTVPSPPHNAEMLPPVLGGRPGIRIMFTVRASCTPSRCHPTNRPVPAIHSPLPPIDINSPLPPMVPSIPAFH